MNTQQTDFEQDEQALSWFDIQDEIQAAEQGRMDYEELESQRLWEEYMERARSQSTSSEEEEEEEKPTTLIGRKRRYSEIEESDSEEEEEDDIEDEDEDEDEDDSDDGIGNCGFRCDGRCRWCESGGYDPRDEA